LTYSDQILTKFYDSEEEMPLAGVYRRLFGMNPSLSKSDFCIGISENLRWIFDSNEIRNQVKPFFE